jgi:hypothetical protein
VGINMHVLLINPKDNILQEDLSCVCTAHPSAAIKEACSMVYCVVFVTPAQIIQI